MVKWELVAFLSVEQVDCGLVGTGITPILGTRRDETCSAADSHSVRKLLSGRRALLKKT